MEQNENNVKIPDLNTCKQYLADAEKIDAIPKEEIDTISLDFDDETLKRLDIIAKEWNVSWERVLQAFIIALVQENEDK